MMKQKQRKKMSERVEQRERAALDRRAALFIDAVTGQSSSDLSEMISSVEGDVQVIRVSPGLGLGTCWQSLAKKHGLCTVEVLTEGWEDRAVRLEQLVRKGGPRSVKQLLRTGGVLKLTVAAVRGIDWLEVKSMMRWSMRKQEWGRSLQDVQLEQLYQWQGLMSSVPAKLREFVRRRWKQRVKKLGGKVVPVRVALRLPAGVRMSRREFRAFWMCKVDEVKAGVPAGLVQRWKQNLRIVQGKGRTVGGMVVNGPKQCRQARLSLGSGSRCSCGDRPELVAVMKSRYPAVWAECGHVFMPLEAVPWRMRDVGEVSLKSEVRGSEVLLQKEAWLEIERVFVRMAGRQVGKALVVEARGVLTVGAEGISKDRRFREGRVVAMGKQCEDGLVVDGLDRDAGRAWLCCAELNDEVARRHFQFCSDKGSYDLQQTSGEVKKYWRVECDEAATLVAWGTEFQRRNELYCDGRWIPWDKEGEMCRVRWMFKRKRVEDWKWGKMIRAIFSCLKDPSRREMDVAAKVVGLICRTVDLSDFSVGSGSEMGSWFRKVESDLGRVLGPDTRLRIDSTDFENFFPSNSKLDVVDYLRMAIRWVFGGGRLKFGVKRPHNTWVSVPLAKKDKAQWGSVKGNGWVVRKVSDVVDYLLFRAEVANLFCVGDVVLGSEEVTIGEKTSPGLCELKARFCEMELQERMSSAESRVFSAARYADDGARVTAVDGSAESERVAAVIGDKIAGGYPGITVTVEGVALPGVGSVEILEYSVGVQQCGRKLWWHHWNKNFKRLMVDGSQQFRKLRPWGSATCGRKLVGVVKERCSDILSMTRGDAVAGSGGVRGSGDVLRDFSRSVLELVTELVVALGYPMNRLLAVVKQLGKRSQLWRKVVFVLQNLKGLWSLVKPSVDAGGFRILD